MRYLVNGFEARISKLKFIYFEGRPNAKKVLDLMDQLSLDFEKFEQNSLPEGNKLKNYSSPYYPFGRSDHLRIRGQWRWMYAKFENGRLKGFFDINKVNIL